MRRPCPRLLLAALLPVLALAGAPGTSLASFTPSTCPLSTPLGFGCASLAVPLDRSGHVPGTVTLKLERKPAAAGSSTSAVIALAGGPGQAALGLGEFVAKAISPALGNRDLILFDQRGTGESGALSCRALSSQNEIAAARSVGELAGRCAQQLGPARGSYTTQESVADIEAIRRAGGYQKLVLYGTSYGTKVALEYAEQYPQHVEALVLDSVVPTSGPEPFSLSTFKAIPGALGELCEARACAGITANATGDLARLAGALSRRALSGSVYNGSGQRQSVTLDESGLLGILQAGDLNPALRALLPAAVVSALRNDPDPLLRLKLLSEGLIPNVPNVPSEEGTSDVDEALFLDTSCEEVPFPWQRAASAQTRLAEAVAAVRAIPAASFAPFDAATALNASLAPACSGWPAAASAPPAQRPLPNVPTLILSGAQDLRTPTSNARSVAAQIPDAQLLVVPFTGHSVLGSDFSGCAERAVAAFFSAATVQPCARTKNVFAPTPVTPRRLEYIRAPAQLPGLPGQTLAAVLDTIVDLERQVIGATLQREAELPTGSSFGGLRGGFARLERSAVLLSRFSFVPGVQLSGVFPVSNGRLQATTIRISGTLAASGTVRIGTGARVSGTLGGKHFDAAISKGKIAAVGGGEWPTGRVLSPLPGLARLP